MYAFSNSSFNTLFLLSWSNRLDVIFQLENIKEDKLVFFTYKQKMIEEDTLNINLKIGKIRKKKEKFILI